MTLFNSFADCPRCGARVELKTDLEIKVYKDGQVIAASTNVIVARGAYDAAIAQYPKAHLELCHRARIIARSDEPQQENTPDR